MMSETNSCRRSLCVGSQLLSMVVAILIAAGVVGAQSPPEKSAQATIVRAVSTDKPGTEAKSDDSAVSDRLKQLEDEVAAMRELIANQQRMIETLSTKAKLGDVVVAAKDSVATEKVDSPAAQKAQPIEDRVKKLESKVLSFGPFRFSGDFRLRLDGIFRGADNTPQIGRAPLPH